MLYPTFLLCMHPCHLFLVQHAPSPVLLAVAVDRSVWPSSAWTPPSPSLEYTSRITQNTMHKPILQGRGWPRRGTHDAPAGNSPKTSQRDAIFHRGPFLPHYLALFSCANTNPSRVPRQQVDGITPYDAYNQGGEVATCTGKPLNSPNPPPHTQLTVHRGATQPAALLVLFIHLNIHLSAFSHFLCNRCGI